MKYKLEKDFSFLDRLDEEQKNAVINSKSRSLVISGPGSGKTMVVVYKIMYLINSGVNPKNILLITFAKAAALEMINRLKKIAENNSEGILFGTFHHLGYSMIKKYHEILKMDENFSVMDSSDSREIIKSCRKSVTDKQLIGKKFPNHKVLQKIFSYSSNTLTPIKKAIKDLQYPYFNFIDQIEEVYKCYTLSKKEQNLVDYDDLLTKTLLLFESHESILIRESKRFEWILVDEFQDTNIVQYKIISLLSTVHGNLIMVGDDSQSIYSFRGANIENIKKLLDSENINIFKIQHNYRSNENIVKLINSIIPNSSYKKNLVSVREKGRKPIIVKTKNRFQQARFITQRIREICDGQFNYNDIAILYRSHYQSFELQMEMQKSKIPYKVFSGLKFNETAHIKDLISFIKIYLNPLDTVSWSRVLMLQPYIGKLTTGKIIKKLRANEWKVEKVLSDIKSKNVKESLEKLRELISREKTIEEFLKNVCEKFYYEYLENKYQDFEQRIMDIERFIDISKKYEYAEDFLSDMLISEDLEKNKSMKSVNLSTIHKAKGLEWKVVFILSVNPGDFPSYQSIEKEKIDEEERIFYVAVTRAMDDLYIIYQENVQTYYGEEYDFIKKIPKNTYEEWEVE